MWDSDIWRVWTGRSPFRLCRCGRVDDDLAVEAVLRDTKQSACGIAYTETSGTHHEDLCQFIRNVSHSDQPDSLSVESRREGRDGRYTFTRAKSLIDLDNST